MSKLRKKNISIKLTDDEKRRVELFADQRDLSISEYFRMSALKHRIKPTVVEIKENDNTAEMIELKQSVHDLEQQLKQKERAFKESLQPLAKYIKDNGFMNWYEYHSDREVIAILQAIKQLEDTK